MQSYFGEIAWKRFLCLNAHKKLSRKWIIWHEHNYGRIWKGDLVHWRSDTRKQDRVVWKWLYNMMSKWNNQQEWHCYGYISNLNVEDFLVKSYQNAISICTAYHFSYDLKTKLGTQLVMYFDTDVTLANIEITMSLLLKVYCTVLIVKCFKAQFTWSICQAALIPT